MHSSLINVIASVKGAQEFTSSYQGRSVRGTVGSSVEFTWSFSGGVRAVDWGLKRAGLADIGEILVSLSVSSATLPPAIPPVEYRRRVRGRLNGDSSSGKAIFALSNITRGDQRLFGCKITASGFPLRKYDFVQLIVEGRWFL